MYVRDVLDDVKNILGDCSNATVFKRLTEAVHIANTKIIDGPNLGVLEICCCDGCVTLPADVGTVLKVNREGRPTVLRDEWFSYLVGGPGNTDWVAWGYTDEVGQVCTYRDPSEPVKLIAVVESAADNNKALRVFGWDANNKRIYTPGPNNTLEDGFLVPTVFGYALPHPTAPAIVRIDRITKDVTKDFIKLVAVDPVTLAPLTQIGYYLPWEVTPTYRRVRAGNRSWIRVKYRKNDITVRGLGDWIMIENTEALMLLLKAVNFRRQNQFQVASSAEAEGIRLLTQDKEANDPPALGAAQVIFNDYPYGGDTLIY
jgi:hypothetical protein